jgi:hypothetical protein
MLLQFLSDLRVFLYPFLSFLLLTLFLLLLKGEKLENLQEIRSFL